MRCCKSSSWLIFFALAWLALLPALALPLSASAAEITPTDARINFDDEGVTLAADFAISLGTRLEDAVTHGITLNFKMECIIERPREYWVSEHIASYAQNFRLSYSNLTRQYRVSIGNLHQNFATLADALRVLGHVSALPITERDKLRPATTYQAALRFALDSSQLPKPFQLDALTSNAWKVDATTLRWSFATP